ncbi:MAG: hypothetical protein ACOYYS_01325 [Chloroflexota bacterium]
MVFRVSARTCGQVESKDQLQKGKAFNQKSILEKNSSTKTGRIDIAEGIEIIHDLGKFGVKRAEKQGRAV